MKNTEHVMSKKEKRNKLILRIFTLFMVGAMLAGSIYTIIAVLAA